MCVLFLFFNLFLILFFSERKLVSYINALLSEAIEISTLRQSVWYHSILHTASVLYPFPESLLLTSISSLLEQHLLILESLLQHNEEMFSAGDSQSVGTTVINMIHNTH